MCYIFLCLERLFVNVGINTSRTMELKKKIEKKIVLSYTYSWKLTDVAYIYLMRCEKGVSCEM